MDPITLSLILSLIAATVKLAPEVVDLIVRAQAGEKISPEEIERHRGLANDAADRWNKAFNAPKET